MWYPGKKFVIFGIAALLAGSMSLSACGSDTSEQSRSATSDQELLVWGWSGSPGADVMSDVIEAFESANPGVNVTYNEIANTEYANAATLGLTSKQDMDVLTVFPNEWAPDNQDFLLPVEEWVNGSELLEAYEDGPFNQAMSLFPDGVLRAVPGYSSGGAVAFYNVDLLEKAGFSEPPKTWKEMAELNEGMAKIAPDVMTTVIPSDEWFQSDVLQTLAGQYDPDFWNKLVYEDGDWNTPAVVQAMTLYQKLFEDGVLDKGTLDISFADAKSLFATGQAAIFYTGIFDAGMLLESNREANGIEIDDVGMMAVPAEDPETVGVRAFLDTSYGIAEHSKNKDLAAKFIEFLTVGDGVDVWSARLAGIPANKGWELPEGTLSSPAAEESMKLIQELLANPHSDRYVLSNFEYQTASYFLEVAAGNMTPEEAAKAGQADWDSGRYN